MPKGFVAEQPDRFGGSPNGGALTVPNALVRGFHSTAEIEPTSGGAFDFTWLEGFLMESRLEE